MLWNNIPQVLKKTWTNFTLKNTVTRVPRSNAKGVTLALPEVADLVAPAGKGVAVYVKNLDAVVRKNVSNEFGMAMLTSAGTYIYTKSVLRY